MDFAALHNASLCNDATISEVLDRCSESPASVFSPELYRDGSGEKSSCWKTLHLRWQGLSAPLDGTSVSCNVAKSVSTVLSLAERICSRQPLSKVNTADQYRSLMTDPVPRLIIRTWLCQYNAAESHV